MIVATSVDNLYNLVKTGEKDGMTMVVREDMPESRPMPLGSFLTHNPGYWNLAEGVEN